MRSHQRLQVADARALSIIKRPVEETSLPKKVTCHEIQAMERTVLNINQAHTALLIHVVVIELA